MDKKVQRITRPRWETIAVSVLPFLVSSIYIFIYVSTQMHGVHAGDSGDLVAAAFVWGIPHPPGYPLYTLLSAILAHVCSFGTVAWRVGFLSSIPMALSLLFLWKSAWYITKSSRWSTIGTLLYGALFPIWLHAIGQEVFGLFSFFASILLYLLIRWFSEQKLWQFCLFCFVFGLSMTHHHLILLTFFAALAVAYQQRRVYGVFLKKSWYVGLACFLVGLLPYVYAAIVSLNHTVLEPGNASTISGFFQLVTRASYGTFRAASGLSTSLIDRLLNMYTFLQFLYRDFTLVGVIGILIGIINLRKFHERYYLFFMYFLFLWIFYYFYAGFPLLLNYHMGTVERFVIVPYQVLTLFFIIGCAALENYVTVRSRNIAKLFRFFFTLCIFGWFLYTTISYVPVMWYLKTNRSMESFALDLDRSIPQNSILFLYGDTTSYAFDYYYYALQQRKDIISVWLPSLIDKTYRERLQKQYPDIIIPSYDTTKPPGYFISEFFMANIANHTFVTDEPPNWLSGTWVPHGLLYVYASDTAHVAPIAVVENKNKYLWDMFESDEKLREYQKRLLLLSDILRIYAQRRLAFVLYLAENNGSEETIRNAFAQSLVEAINVTPEPYVQVSTMLINKKRCQLAHTFLDKVYEKWGADYVILLGYHRLLDVCLIDTPSVRELDALYHKKNPVDSSFSQ